MILKQINKWFSRNKLDFVSIKYSDLSFNEHSILFKKIFYDQLDYILIEDFFTIQELTSFQNKIHLYTESHPELVDVKDNGYTFGKTLFDTDNLDNYKNLAVVYERISEELFGYSIKNKIIDLLHKLSDINSIQPASFKDDHEYVSNTIRVMQPQKGGLFVHSDLDIHYSFNESAHIMSMINTTTILSMFVILQSADKGGDLFIYDKKYDHTPESVYKSKDKFSNIKKYLTKYNFNKVHVPCGSLIFFNAGQRWHAIEPIHGNKARITAGCFTGYAKNNKKIFIWS